MYRNKSFIKAVGVLTETELKQLMRRSTVLTVNQKNATADHWLPFPVRGTGTAALEAGSG